MSLVPVLVAPALSIGLTCFAWHRFRQHAPAHAWALAPLTQIAVVAGHVAALRAGQGALFIGCAVLAVAALLLVTIVPRLTRALAPAALALAVTVAGLAAT